MTTDPRLHAVLGGASRAAVLDVLRRAEQPLGVAEVAEQVGLHPNTVRAHLDLLLESGYAIRNTEPPKGPGRPRIVYSATAAPEDGRNYRLLAEMLAGYLAATAERPGEAAAAAGRAYAAHAEHEARAGEAGTATIDAAEAIERVVRLLGDTGFAPELAPDRQSIRLHRCPFREVATARPDVVCGAHLGLIQGALAEMGAPVEATRLLPFVEPDLCVATLAATGGDEEG